MLDQEAPQVGQIHQSPVDLDQVGGDKGRIGYGGLAIVAREVAFRESGPVDGTEQAVRAYGDGRSAYEARQQGCRTIETVCSGCKRAFSLAGNGSVC